MNQTMDMIPLEVRVQHPTSAHLARGAQAALDMATAFDVADDASYALAAEELSAIKGRAARLEEQRKAITRPMDEAKAAVMDLFRGPLQLLQQAEAGLKGKMLAYTQAAQRRAAEERRRAEEAAAAERARLAAEAAALEQQGRAGEAEVQRHVATMVVAAAPAVAAPKAAGISTTSAIDYEVEDLHQLIRHIAERPELVHLLQPDSVRLRAYARAVGEAGSLPGVRIFRKQTIAARRG